MNSKILSVFVIFLLGLTSFALAAPIDGQNGAVAQQTQEKMQIRIQDGTHFGEGGQMMQFKTQANNQMRLEVGGIGANSDLELKQQMVGDATKLSVGLSNGKNAEIKVMPDKASETALEKLKLKTCSEENECSIELKEVGSGDKIKAAYEVKTQRQAKVLGLFKAQMQVQAQVDAETGEVLRVKKNWWAFLASEPAEE